MAEEQQMKRVFVGNLAYNVRWFALKDFMRSAGEVQYASVRMSPNGRSKGCGIVEYSTVEEAQNAIATLNDQELNGRPIFVREDREKPGAHRGPPGTGVQVQVSNLASNVTWNELKDLVRDAGFNPLRADVNVDAEQGTVTVRSTVVADAVVAALQGKEVHGKTIAAKTIGATEGHTTQPETEVQSTPTTKPQSAAESTKPTAPVGESDGPSKQLVVFNLPFTTRTPDLASFFENFAPVVSAEVFFKGGRSRGQGVVEFTSIEDAIKAKDHFHESDFDGRTIRIEFNARWRHLTPLKSGTKEQGKE